MTLRSLSIAATGTRALQDHIDTIANNIANVNTIAYKRIRANFADLLYQQIQRAGFGVAGLNMQPTGLYFGTGVKLVSTDKVFTQGTLTETKGELDLAIDGEGFFQVILPDGSIAYTRAGNFKLDRDRNIVTAQGYRLTPQITVAPEIQAISVDVNGSFWGFDPASPGALIEIGRIELARFINPSGLEAIGDNLYRQTTASGDPITGSPGTDPQFGRIRQGFLEESNVDIVRELTDMISAQRAFEINTSVIRTADEILQAINNLRR